jgi:hypothetical protein
VGLSEIVNNKRETRPPFVSCHCSLTASLHLQSFGLISPLLIQQHYRRYSKKTIKMRVAIFAPIFAAAVLAQDSVSRCSLFVSPCIGTQLTMIQSASSSVDPAPQTSYLQQTNSLGVVTGMPAVATSIPSQPAVVTSQPAVVTEQPSVVTEQPSVVTSQPPVVSIPAVGTGIHTVVLPPMSGSNSSNTVVVSANNSTTVLLNTGSPSGSGLSGSATRTPTGPSGSDASKSSSATGAQSSGAAATMGALAGSVVGVGAFMAAFL